MTRCKIDAMSKHVIVIGGGVIGGRWTGEACGSPNVITIDIDNGLGNLGFSKGGKRSLLNNV